jgi:myosin heavy subunit
MAFDLSNLSPEEQKLFDAGFGKAKADADAHLKELEKLKQEHQDALKKLTDKDNKIKSTEEERQAQLKRLEELENAGKSEKEKLEIALKKAQEASEKAQKELEGKASAWKEKYFDTLKRSALVEAGREADLYNPNQLDMMLRNNISVEEVKEGDKVSYVPFLTLEGEDGVPVKHKVKDGVTEFLKKNPNLIKSKIIRDENKIPEGVIVKGGDGKPTTVDLSKASVDEINEHFGEIHSAITNK